MTKMEFYVKMDKCVMENESFYAVRCTFYPIRALAHIHFIQMNCVNIFLLKPYAFDLISLADARIMMIRITQ